MVSITGETERTAFFVGMVSPIIFDFVVYDVGCKRCGVTPSMIGFTLSMLFRRDLTCLTKHTFRRRRRNQAHRRTGRRPSANALSVMSLSTENTNVGSPEVGINGNRSWFCCCCCCRCCCHCRKLSASREYKGKSDENAISITMSASHSRV